MSKKAGIEIAVVWRGDRAAREAATPMNNRFHRVFEELALAGIHATPAVFDEAFAEEFKTQLLLADGVLVWVDPLDDGRTRRTLDPLLRDVAASGTWVSAHPDVILKMGVKEVLHRTRHLGWGVDTELCRTASEFQEGFPGRLATAGPRVIKRNRGNGGQGIWKVELSDTDGRPSVCVLEARRGSMPETVALTEFLARCAPYFVDGGIVVDQPFQPRLPEGMIRCYMAADRVVGYGHQLVKALVAPPPDGPDAEEAHPGRGSCIQHRQSRSRHCGGR